MPRHQTLAATLALLAASTLGAQTPDTTAADTSAAELTRAAACDGRRISDITVLPAPPRLIGERAPRWSRPFLRAILQHRTTRPEAVRPFIISEEGDECDPFRLSESERILRTQPYIADATIRAIPDDTGTVRLEVETVDEIPVVVGVGVRGGDLSKLKYGSENAFGQGAYAAAQWRRGFAYRDAFGGRFVHYHLFDRPIRLTAAGERDVLGHDAIFSVERPFYTRLQRTAWQAGARESSDYLGFTRPEGPALSLPYDRTFVEAGGVFRIGTRSVMLFAGPSVVYERARVSGDAVVVSDTGLAADPDPTLDGRFPDVERTSIMGVAGVRLLRYLTVQGFDALLGPQDAGVGTQFTGALGRVFGTGEDAWGVAGDLYMGAGTARSFVAVRSQWEGLREPSRWTNLVGSGRLAWYLKPSRTGTMIVSGEYSVASRQRRPFQISLGDRYGGVRGYDDSRVRGARRAVLRAERRWVVGGISDWVALGVAGFADAGKVWAGSVPYGRTTGIRASAGASLLAAAPRQSRRLFRLDVAVPLMRDVDAAGYEIRLTTTRPVANFWREPRDVARVRAVMPAVGTLAWQ